MSYPAAMKKTGFLFLIGLAACSTPKEDCLNEALRDLTIVQSLIAESEETIRRGYSLKSETHAVQSLNFCLGTRSHRTGFGFCNHVTPITKKTPVAVNLDEEQAKLRSLKKKEQQLRKESLRQQASCEAAFQDG